MQTATLGGLIKDFRIKKRLSQLEVSVRIGWRDTTRLSKIEQGRVNKPTRETAEKVIKALDLSGQERGEFLLVGGFLPTDEEIQEVIREFKSKVDNWPYPAYIMDFSFRWLYTNLATLEVACQPKEVKAYIEKNKPSFLEYPFVPYKVFPVEVLKGEDKDHLKPFKVAQIAAFKLENRLYQDERWYKKLVNYLVKYDEFRQLWPKVTPEDYDKKSLNYEYKRMTGVYRGEKRTLDFHLSTAVYIGDPRFQVVLYYPADDQTYKFYQKA